MGQGAGCLSGFGTYLPCTVLQGCRLFKRCGNLPAEHCVAGVQAVNAMSEPSCRTLSCRGAGCLCDVGTNLPGTVMQGCRLFMQCRNLLARHCVTEVQAGNAVSEPTGRALCCRGASCLSMSEPTCWALCCRDAG